LAIYRTNVPLADVVQPSSAGLGETPSSSPGFISAYKTCHRGSENQKAEQPLMM
jgi:hypothetical protein